MRKVTVWRMRERYAQTVFTFRITQLSAQKQTYNCFFNVNHSDVFIYTYIVQRINEKQEFYYIRIFFRTSKVGIQG